MHCVIEFVRFGDAARRTVHEGYALLAHVTSPFACYSPPGQKNTANQSRLVQLSGSRLNPDIFWWSHHHALLPSVFLVCNFEYASIRCIVLRHSCVCIRKDDIECGVHQYKSGQCSLGGIAGQPI